MIETIDLTKIFNIGRKRVLSRQSYAAIQSVKALDHVNLEVQQGELFGLLGPNGAGKTTLIKVLSTLLIPDEGTARVNGFDIMKDPSSVRNSIGTLFSVGDKSFFWRLNGRRNLEFYASMYNVPRNKRRERIQQVLEIVGLSQESSLVYQRYSLGMKRKLMFARTLLSDPPILFLDEPTANLDPISARSMRSYIKSKLNRELGRTIIFTTHNLEEASELCDRICVLHKGHVLVCDKPDAIKGIIKERRSFEITVKNVTASRIEQLKQLITEAANITCEIDRNNCDRHVVQLRVDDLDSLRAIFGFLSQDAFEIVDLSYKRPTLEEAFIYLIQKED